MCLVALVWVASAAKGLFCGLFLHIAADGCVSPRRAPRPKLLCYFPKQIYVTGITLRNSRALRSTFSRLVTHPATHTRARVHTHTHTHVCTQTHLVLLQGSLLLHVRTVFAGDNSFDISHRHCREDRSEWTTTTTTTTTSSTSQMGGCFIQTIKKLNFSPDPSVLKTNTQCHDTVHTHIHRVCRLDLFEYVCLDTHICPAGSRGAPHPGGSLPNLHSAGLYGSEKDGNTKTYLEVNRRRRTEGRKQREIKI